MRFKSHLLFAAVICILTSASYGQTPAWNSFRYSKVSLKYPSTWKTAKVSEQGHQYVTLTPDSMKNLSMKVMEMFELPLGGDHTYARFKKDFATVLNSQPDNPTKVLKAEEITFKEHKTMYAEIIRSSLPAKVYAIHAGNSIYLIFLLQSRHVNVPDPKMEKDGAAIMNSFTIDQ